MGDSSFTTGLQATNDIYARHAGLTAQPKGENLVEVEEPPPAPDAAEAGLAPVEGAVKPKKAPAKKTAAKKTAAKKAAAKKTADKK